MQISASSALVVGGAGGLGEATVRRLHAAGAKVVVADLTDDKGKELASELGARYVRTDATDGVRGVRAEHCRKRLPQWRSGAPWRCAAVPAEMS